MSFSEWFEKKLTVGAFPCIVNKEFDIEDGKYDYIINMSDEFHPSIDKKMRESWSKVHWFPMNERRRDIGLNSIYGAMLIMYQAEITNASVYLHCHSGRNRSQLTKACYFFIRTGTQLQDGNEKYINRLQRASSRGYLPPIAEMEEFLKNIGKRLLRGTMEGGVLDECKIGTINNF